MGRHRDVRIGELWSLYILDCGIERIVGSWSRCGIVEINFTMFTMILLVSLIQFWKSARVAGFLAEGDPLWDKFSLGAELENFRWEKDPYDLGKNKECEGKKCLQTENLTLLNLFRGKLSAVTFSNISPNISCLGEISFSVALKTC